MRKIIAISALMTLLLGNGLTTVNALEYGLTPSNIKLTHKPFWLFTGDDADYAKNIQLRGTDVCEDGGNFSVLNAEGNVISSHIDEGCSENTSSIGANNYPFLDNLEGNSDNDFDDLFGNLFNVEETPTQEFLENTVIPTLPTLTTGDEVINTEADDFLNIIFGTSSDINEAELFSEYDEESGLNSASELELFPDTNESPLNSSTESESIEDIDALFLDLFGRISEKDYIENAKSKEFTLKGKDLFETIQAYGKLKDKTAISGIEVSLVEGEDTYNNKIIEILQKVNKEFQIESIKNDFAKNIGDLSYSLVNYKNKDLGSEIREGFRNKIITDVVKIESKYKTLKRKDMIISKGINNKNSL